MRTSNYKKIYRSFIVLCAVGVIMVGCKKKDNPVLSSLFSGSTVEDIAESVSASLGDDNGGASDNIADVAQLASGFSLSGSSLEKTEAAETVDTSYNDATGEWTVTLTRQRSSQTGLTSASFSRVYKYTLYRDINDANSFQKYRNVNGTLATAMKFKVVSGSGTFKTPRIDHKLTSLTGSFIVTNLDKDTLLINSDEAYVRTGSDTITTRNAIRTLNNTTTLTFSAVKAPRFRLMTARKNFSKAYSGTVTGTVNATVSVQKGEVYNERTINKTFTVTLNSGEGSITVDGKGFKCDIQTGEREDNP